MLATQMKSCGNFEELVSLCASTSHHLPPLDMTNFTNVRLNRDAEDLISRSFIPEDCRVLYPFAIRSTPDGSCFAHAASRLVFGHEDFHKEIRCRIVIEGVMNREIYLDPEYMKRGIRNYRYKCSVPELYATLGGAYDGYNSKEDVALIYNRDIFNYRLDGEEAGQFQMVQLVNVIGAPLMSIYPILKAHEGLQEGHLQQRKTYNRVIAPYSMPWSDHLNDHIAGGIMWTMSNAGFKRPNHFVAVVP